MYNLNHPAPAPETARDTTSGPRTPRLKMPHFSHEEPSSADKEEAGKPLGGEWDTCSSSSSWAEITRADTGQHKPQVLQPAVSSATGDGLTARALEKLRVVLPDRSNNAGQWARTQSLHGESLGAERPQEGIPPAGDPEPEAAEAERPRDHPKAPSSSRPSTSSSEGFAHVDLPSEVERDLIGTGARFDVPTPYLATMTLLEVDEPDAPAKKGSGSRASKGRK
ncbi:hypothetical protein GGTG_06033 [Gaeumannomyces tritici R3-111a-1]|uniref:Uncharacterized protein n=1 Tax=Gaeumannomyces tritici (strain R3-111a-1) TaxID=644352 RepID=J3NXM7_GAET3|nr:hypothetical protein GGTG_06033 [Gaeumannomyces tritici R3-111a-1]EJT76109.1 hypothetical protein GGTG_06033 [Gaeumannomyces tritici R3-111a-1]